MAEARQGAVQALEAAKAKAETSRAGTLGAARTKAEERLKAATAEVDAAGKAAEKELREGAEGLARAIAGKLMGREVA